jgi:CDP-glucose 4,6-dehydratase
MEGVVVSDDPASTFWRDRPVLVTGATGFLGSHLTGLLVERGASVVVVARDDVPRTPVRTWDAAVSTVRGDVTDQTLLERTLGEYEVRTVFHLAAQTQVEVSNRNPVSTFDSNIRGTWALLDAVRRSPATEQVVVASSDKAYGTQPVLPYSEEMPLRAVNPYDVSKACADLISLSYAEVFEVPVSVTRCGNFFGPGDTNWNRLIPGTVRSLARGQQPLIRSNGELIRDYLYVVDGALAYLATAEAMATTPGTVGEAFNFSTEGRHTVLDVVRAISAVMGSDLEPIIEGRIAHEIPDQYLSAAKAREVLGWKPLWSFEEALALTIDWYVAWLRDNHPSA